MKDKLSRIRSPWRRFIIRSLVTIMFLFAPKRKAIRSRVHWVGYDHRPRRLERHLVFVLVPLAMLIFEPREYVIWALSWGLFFSLYFNVMVAYRLAARRSEF